MSDDIEITNHFKEKDIESISFAESEGFQEFFDKLEAAAEEGEALANLIATAVMTLFSPGFVLIGSPVMETNEEGLLMPSEVGVCLSSATDLTPTGLAELMRRLADAIDEDVEAAMNSLKDDDDSN